MKEKELQRNTQRESGSSLYHSPEVEVMEMRVESGFAASQTGANEDFTNGTGSWD